MNKIIKALYSFKNNGFGDTIAKIKLHIKKNKNKKKLLKKLKIKIRGLNKIIFPVLSFVKADNPLVSIIIPVYNKFNYTYNCLYSILKNTDGNIEYEIIIADDNSNDKTKYLNKIVKNIIIIRTDNNMGFLKNCNNAAKHAKGKYLLFLNNDTQVQKKWLAPLVKLPENDTLIGLAGSKFIYPNGLLQMAGGIIWQDGSSADYGNGFDPSLPEFNYVKDVDYICGASLIVRHNLWKKLGGFDERYAPSYCEDSDLAFSVRKEGYRVVYQPASVVVHFESITHGKGNNSAYNKYQGINQKHLYNKWYSVLKNNHFNHGENVFLARSTKNINEKIILIIDRAVPHYDHDTGSRTIYTYIKLFLQLNFHVIFLGNDTLPYQPYTSVLQQMGVEVLYGDYFIKNWKEWIENNGQYINFVLTCRSNVSINYIDFLREHTNAKIIYFNEDMPHIRLQRQFEITGNPDLLTQSKGWEKLETEVSKKADILYVVGSYEEQMVKELFPQKTVRNIPALFYNKLHDSVIPAYNRKNLLFVGAFGHAPNEDAVLWFYNHAFSDILNKYPNIVLYIVGSNPTAKILAIQNKHIIVTGRVTDEQLENYYNNCRICVVPLRFGAGVKGKIIEAAYYRIPVITTEIGAEGFSLEEDAFVINPPDDTFAKTVIDLYEDYNRLEQLSANCIKFIKNHFSVDSAIRIISKDIDVGNSRC